MENEAINGTNPEVGQTTPPESPKKFCKYCGERIDIDCVVYPKCGKQIEGQQAIIEAITPKSEIEELRSEVSVLKLAIRTMNQEIAELKKAQ